MEVIGLKEKLAGNRLLKSNMFPAFFVWIIWLPS